MATERLDLGPSPDLEISLCSGHLEVRGSDRAETIIESSTPQLEVSLREGGATIDRFLAHGTIRVPRGARVRGGQVRGHLRLRGIDGEIQFEGVGGSCEARHTGPLDIQSINGDVRIRKTGGPVSLGIVRGSANLRDVEASIRIEEIGGSLLGRNIPLGVEVGLIRGDLSLRTDFSPETTYRFDEVGGDVLLRVPDGSDVRIIAKARGDLSFDETFAATTEGEYTILTQGSGSATVHVTAKGSIALRKRGDYSIDEDFAGAFEDFDAHIANLASLMTEEFTSIGLEVGSRISERVRRKVARKLETARRHMEAAQKQVEQAVESAHKQAGRFAPSVDVEDQRTEPMSPEERLAILKMLEEGKINVEEAEQLLAVIEGQK